MITFESLHVRSSYLHIQCISEECVSSLYMKVIGSRSWTVIHPLLSCHPYAFSDHMNTTAQMASALRQPGAACKHDDGKLHASYPGLENIVIFSKILKTSKISKKSNCFDIALAHTLQKYKIYYEIIVCVCVLCILGEVLSSFTLHCCGEVQSDRSCPTVRKY